MKFRWYGDQREAELKVRLLRNMGIVVSEVENDIKQSMRSTPRGETGHSLPGNPPAVQRSILIGSIFSDTTTRDKEVVGLVGSRDVLYAALTEFGTDHMAARPWLVPALQRMRVRIKEILRRA